VVIASRCHAGPTEPVYGTDGGGATLAAHEHVRFAHVTPWSARVALALAIPADRVAEQFAAADG
jgi:L-asparaginase